MKKRRNADSADKKPAITINIQSWATPIVGIIMLVIGLFGGYYGGQPANGNVGEQAAAPQINAPAPVDGTDTDNEELMDYVISQSRHFKGDPDAPVTLVEFGDFQ
jgi:hypothetical protein